MKLQIQTDQERSKGYSNNHLQYSVSEFSKDYVDFLSEAGWKLEKKFPSNNNHYSDLLEDTDWKYDYIDLEFSKHYRRDLDALS